MHVRFTSVCPKHPIPGVGGTPLRRMKFAFAPGFLALIILLSGCSSMQALRTSDDGVAPQRDEALVEASHIGLLPESEQDTALDDPEGVMDETGTASMRRSVKGPRVRSGNENLFARGIDLVREGKDELAAVLFMEIAEDQPGLAGPWANLGLIHMRADQLEKAQEAFEQALAANPRHCDALTQMGVIARKQGRFDDAEQYYRRCIKADGGYAAARLNLGILYELYMGRYSEALVAYGEYQMASAQPDPRVNGWMLDLERRVERLAQR